MLALRHLATPSTTAAPRRVRYRDYSLVYCTDAGTVVTAAFPRILVKARSVSHTWIGTPVCELQPLGDMTLLRAENGSMHVLIHKSRGRDKHYSMSLPAPITAYGNEGLLLASSGAVFIVSRSLRTVCRVPFDAPIRDATVQWPGGVAYWGLARDGTLRLVNYGRTMPVTTAPADIEELRGHGDVLYCRTRDGTWFQRRTGQWTVCDAAPPSTGLCQHGGLRYQSQSLSLQGVVRDAVRTVPDPTSSDPEIGDTAGSGTAQPPYFLVVVTPRTGPDELLYVEYEQRANRFARRLRHVIDLG